MFDRESAPASARSDYRLPTHVTPKRYELRITPNLGDFTFAGEETVAIVVKESTREIVLNALELEIDQASVDGGGKTIAATVEPDAARERVRLCFGQALAPGDWSLRLSFRGILNDKLHGFYRSQYRDHAGATHTVAATQFEATDARRAFPCWDEPELKARFKVSLVVDENLTAISNAGVHSERKLPNGKKEVIFGETIPMSTYLVAFIVGEFEATPPVDAGGFPLRIVHVPGKGGLTGWAKEVGRFSLKFFADYYGLNYPGDKLDLVAIPDFASGAMENLGAITFRETALLIDEQSASRAELERVADVVSHENAHMWFGDLVTMRWWNGIWLNEAFATFMEMLAVDAWKPQWRRWESFSLSRAGAMAIDGLRATRSVEFTVQSPEEARAMFDVLTYEKGAAVLRMLEQFLGADEFRKGIALYLRKHEYANAETSDLWDALEQSSGHPVRRMMHTWIFQEGFPIISVTPAEPTNAVRLSQSRFLYLGDEKNQQVWHVPVMVRARTSAGIERQKLLLTDAQTTIKFAANPRWVLLNEGSHGFYRVHYSPALLSALTRNLGELQAVERFALVSDTWAATVAGLTPLGDFLSMAALFGGETDLNVWRSLIAPFSYLDMVIEDAQRPALAARVCKLLGPAFERLGWAARPNEDELSRQLRGTLLGTLGTLGDDAALRERAAKVYTQYLASAAAVDRDIVPALVNVLAYGGDEARYEEFKQRFKSARTPQEEQRYLFSLAAFRAPALLRQTMQMALSGEVRTQNAPYLVQSLLLNTACRYQAWEFMRSNWDAMVKRFPDSALPRMCEGIIGLLDREQEVRQFFAAHKVRLGGKLIDQHLERLSIAVKFRADQGEHLGALLAR